MAINNWSPNELESLEQYYLDDLSGKEISKQLERTECAVFHKAARLGLKSIFPSGVRPQESPNIEMSPDWAYLLGVLIGDGCAYERGLVFGTSDYDWVAILDKKIVNVFNRTPKIRYLPSRFETFPTGTYLCKPSWSLYLNYRGIGRLLLDKTKAKNWQIPEEIWKANDYEKAQFLQGYFDSDGSVVPTNHSINVTSINENGLLEVQELLRCFSIPSKLSKQKKKYSALGIYHTDNFIRFFEHIGFSIKRKQDRLLALIKQNISPPTKMWTVEEHNFFKNNYALTDVSLLSMLLGRSKSSLYHKGSRMGVSKKNEV